LATSANSTYLPEGCQYPLIHGQGALVTPSRAVVKGYWITSKDICTFARRCPVNKERGNLFAIPLKKLEVKIKIQETTVYLKTYKRFIFYVGSVNLYHF
jgi:hypothetical protein